MYIKGLPTKDKAKKSRFRYTRNSELLLGVSTRHWNSNVHMAIGLEKCLFMHNCMYDCYSHGGVEHKMLGELCFIFKHDREVV